MTLHLQKMSLYMLDLQAAVLHLHSAHAVFRRSSALVEELGSETIPFKFASPPEAVGGMQVDFYDLAYNDWMDIQVDDMLYDEQELDSQYSPSGPSVGNIEYFLGTSQYYPSGRMFMDHFFSDNTCSCLSMAAINSFLSLDLNMSEASSVTLSSDLMLSWSQEKCGPPLLSFHKELPEGGTLLGIVLSSDKMNISVMSGNCMAHPLYVSVPALPPYYHPGKDGDTKCVDDHDSFPFQHGKFPVSGDTDIDNISPNEDKRMAEAALHTPEPDLRSESANFYSVPSHVPTPELAYHGQDKQDSQSLVATHPADSQIDPALLAISEQCYGEDSDIQQPSSGITILMPAQNVACGVAQSSQLSPGSPGPPTMVVLTANVIKHEKLIAQCNSATKNPFLPCSTFLDILSGEIFNEALVKCMNTPPGYWPNYCSQLGILLWEWLMMWQLTIKVKAHGVLP
ncbi:hypothetical protein EDC04DRAFT_2604559 [Pisolithus marmoratus]|nr:hypothetical protein EDC04DRAFT_2604559 [Pisolithus marmoratus]